MPLASPIANSAVAPTFHLTLGELGRRAPERSCRVQVVRGAAAVAAGAEMHGPTSAEAVPFHS